MKQPVFSAVAALALLIPTSANGSISEFVGNWEPADEKKEIEKLRIWNSGAELRLQIFGSCAPQDCDWGEVQAQPFGRSASADLHDTAGALTARYVDSSSTRLVLVHLARVDHLRVEILTSFTDGSARTSYRFVQHLKRAGVQAIPVQYQREDCLWFDPDRIRVGNFGGRWKIVSLSSWMFDFGGDEGEARWGLKMIKHYRANQTCFVGRPGPSFSYLLVSGKAPAGAMDGERCAPFNPASISVVSTERNWKIVQGGSSILEFGDKEDEGREALRLIHKYGFDRLCSFGSNENLQHLRQ